MENETQLVFTRMTKPPRKNSMWLALVLSLFTSGLGQLYNGQLLRCVLFYLMNFIILLICSFAGLMDTITGLITFLILTAFWRLYTIADAMLIARKEIPSHRINPKWYVLVAVGVGMLLCNALIPYDAMSDHKTFSIPSTGNVPTLFPREYVVADMSYYEDHPPEYGDMIVYEGEDGFSYTFRVVGLPGDQLQLLDDVPVIDGVRNTTEYLRDTGFVEGEAEIHRETLPNGRVHEITLMKTKFEGSIVTTEPQLIPEGYVYVLGDHRDNAMDSRYIGLIRYARIQGKCLYVYWSTRPGRIGTRLDQ